MEPNPVARQRLGRFSVTVSTQDLLDRSTREVSNDFYCSCNFRCCCRCDGNFLRRSDLAPTLITKLTFQQVGDELEGLMTHAIHQKILTKLVGEKTGDVHRHAVDLQAKYQALISQNQIQNF